MWNRAGAARWGTVRETIPCAPFAVSQHPWRAARIFIGKELRRRKAALAGTGPAAFVCLAAAPAPFRQAPRKSSSRASCRQEIRAALGILRGRLRVRWDRGKPRARPLVDAVSVARAADAFLSFAGALVARPGDARTLQLRWISVNKTMR